MAASRINDSFGRAQPTTADEGDRMLTPTFESATGGTVNVSMHTSDPSGCPAGSFENLQEALTKLKRR